MRMDYDFEDYAMNLYTKGKVLYGSYFEHINVSEHAHFKLRLCSIIALEIILLPYFFFGHPLFSFFRMHGKIVATLISNFYGMKTWWTTCQKQSRILLILPILRWMIFSNLTRAGSSSTGFKGSSEPITESNPLQIATMMSMIKYKIK